MRHQAGRDRNRRSTLHRIGDGHRFAIDYARIEIDPASGAITQLAAHIGGMLGLGGTTTAIDAQAIISVGPELMIVDTEASVLAAPH